MKNLMLIIGVLISTISFGADTHPLKNELTEKLIFDLSDVELDNNHEDFVLVNFHIFDGEIEITEITGTQIKLIQKVKKKMSLLKIDEDYEEGKLYHYKLTFKKV